MSLTALVAVGCVGSPALMKARRPLNDAGIVTSMAIVTSVVPIICAASFLLTSYGYDAKVSPSMVTIGSRVLGTATTRRLLLASTVIFKPSGTVKSVATGVVPAGKKKYPLLYTFEMPPIAAVPLYVTEGSLPISAAFSAPVIDTVYMSYAASSLALTGAKAYLWFELDALPI